MPEMKPISHQSIHSTKAEPSESQQKPSEIVKESKLNERPELTKEQQESLKQSKIAEGKLAESAIRAKTEGFYAPEEAPDVFNSGEKHVFYHEKENLKRREAEKGKDESSTDKKQLAADQHTFHHDQAVHDTHRKKPKDIVTNRGADPSQTGPIIAGPIKDGIKELFGGKDGKIFQTGGSEQKDNIQQSLNEESDFAERPIKAEKFFPYIQIPQIPATPIDDSESAREEEPIVAESPTKKSGKSPEAGESDLVPKEGKGSS